MSKYAVLIQSLHEATAAPDRADFEPFLFNEPGHLRSQPCSEGFAFRLFHPARQRIAARFNLFIQHRTGLSPCRAPFGSVEFSGQLATEALDFFLDGIEAFVRSRELATLRITGYPFAYAPAPAQILAQRLLNRGYAVVQAEKNFHLPVGEAPFQRGLHPTKKRYLNKCRRAGFTFAEETQPDVARVYDFVAASRQHRGFPVSLDGEALRDLFERFPADYKVFTVRDADRLAALTVAVVVNHRILYSFYTAHDACYQAFSPVVLLTEGVYGFCQRHSFGLLDLGTSPDGGNPNYGLIRFKQHLGAQVSLKLSFEKAMVS
ncbi:MAG: GNAT family N-acetyltransferase [Ferruginibacter sp.]|nr:GNAT family N-acetyltransferase [Cytophagales bacterium]